jgi:aryl-alcohol dehydrogenase-like predicted oxidoreductase
MEMRELGTTGLKTAPLVLGGNVFGWTVDRDTGFAILDAFLEAGFNAIDTADVYFRYAPGKKGGESETMLGEWMKDRGVRDRVLLITKGGLDMDAGGKGLGRDYLPRACEASLKRLQTDHIDVYMSHRPDPDTPIAETMEAFQGLVDAGKIRVAGCSGYTPEQLTESLKVAGSGRARYEVVEPLYNLIDRSEYEGPLEKICVENKLAVTPYYGLAAGFLTGKYRSKKDLNGARAQSVEHYLTPEGLGLLDRLDAVAARHGATPAQVAVAWLIAHPTITAPIASATSLDQLRGLLKAASLKLTPEDFKTLEG